MATTIYEDLEIAVLAALAPLAIGGNVEVVQFPDDDQEFKKVYVKPRISAIYHSFDTEGVISTGMSTAGKPTSVQVIFEARKRRGPLGIYDLAVQAEPLLSGLKVPNFSIFTIGKFSKGGRSDAGVWQYNLIINTMGATNQVIDNSARWGMGSLVTY